MSFNSFKHAQTVPDCVALLSSVFLLLLLVSGLTGCRTTAKSPSSDLAYADTGSLRRLPPVRPSEMFTPMLLSDAPRPPDSEERDLVALAEQRAAARARAKRPSGAQQAAGTS